MAIISVDALKKLSKSLGDTVDQYERLIAKESHVSPMELGGLQQKINMLAGEIATETMNPIFAALNLGMTSALSVGIRIANDLNMFDLIDRPITVEELSKKTGAHPEILVRWLRVLAAFKYIKQDGPDTFDKTILSQCLSTHPIQGYANMTFDDFLPAFLKMPSYFAVRGYQPISNANDTPHVAAFGKSLFEHLAQHPDRQADFDAAMLMQDQIPPNQLAYYPFFSAAAADENDVEGKEGEKEGVFLVDVGGGHGQFLRGLHAANPAAQQQQQRSQRKRIMVLQDLPQTTEALKKEHDLPFEVMSYDFFTPQPIVGARYYYLRSILHEWPDHEAISILAVLSRALRSNHSKILIDELILPEIGCPPFEAYLDISMMAAGGAERTASQWDRLFKSAGVEITGITNAEVGLRAVMELDVVRK